MNWSENLSNRFHEIWLNLFLPPDTPIITAVSTLIDGFLFYSSIVLWVSLGSCLYQKFPCFIGDPKFLEGLLHACEQCPGKSYPCLLVLLFSGEEGLLGFITFYLAVLIWWPYFLFIL